MRGNASIAGERLKRYIEAIDTAIYFALECGMSSRANNSIAFAGVDEVLAAVREQVLFARDVVVQRRRRLSRIDVQPVLSLFRESYGESHDIVIGYVVRHILRQALFFEPVFVQCRHEICQRAGHAELNFQFSARKNQCFLWKIILLLLPFYF